MDKADKAGSNEILGVKPDELKTNFKKSDTNLDKKFLKIKKIRKNSVMNNTTTKSKYNKSFFMDFLRLNKKLKITEIGKFTISVNDLILKSITKIINFLFKGIKYKISFILKQKLNALMKLLNDKQKQILSKQVKQFFE